MHAIGSECFMANLLSSVCIVEYTVGLHGDNGGMVVIAHSMGNGVFRYFLEWLKLELGRNHWQAWIDKHISTYFAVGSPLLGSSEALELLSSGLTQGLPITQREVRKLVATFGTRAYLVVMTPAGMHTYAHLVLRYRLDRQLPADSVDAQLDARYGHAHQCALRSEYRWHQALAELHERRDRVGPILPRYGRARPGFRRPRENSQEVCYNLHVHQVLLLWIGIDGGCLCAQILRRRRRARSLGALGAPAHCLCLLGLRGQPAGTSLVFLGLRVINRHILNHGFSHHSAQTKHNYKYQDTDTAGHWYQLSLDNEDSSRHSCSKTGDATVPYHSLSWAHTWLGDKEAAVDVTQVPQSVYFSEENIRTFKATRNGLNHHAEYTLHGRDQPMCSSPDKSTAAAAGLLEGFFKTSTLDQITFFERREPQTKNGGGAVQTTGVWEIDGAGHREILGNPAFLRELRAEMRSLFTTTKQTKTDMSSDKTSRPPVIDGDCYWNYRQAKCAFSDFCEYRYAFGDVILDQSCRLRPRRKRPAATRPPLVEKIQGVESEPQPQLEEKPMDAPVEVGPSEILDIVRPYCSAPYEPLPLQPHELATRPPPQGNDIVCTKA